ncbi:MAG: Uma2 family endonuclease [Pirellulaceae bacterium]|nr:Uma2 family endonuclease [Pirellulaceae bacterium]
MSSSTLRLTVAQYDAMVQKGAFDDLPQKIELIHGEIQARNPAGPVHDDLIEYLNHWSTRNTDDAQIRVRVQGGLSLPELASRPEPDLMWIRADRPRGRLPLAREVLLLIEVADSSLRIDRTLKADLYAAAGVTEYWIVNSVDRLLHVYRDPGAHGYASVTTFRPGDSAPPLAEPQARLSLSDLFATD